MPLIDVIVPVYNVAPYLARCLDSVLAQTEPDWRCILIDDGSTDNSAAIAAGYAARDCRFVLLTQPNCGLSAARNRGLDESRGDYLTFLDSDDMLHPRCLEALRAQLEADNSDVAVCHYAKFTQTLPEADRGGPVEHMSGEQAVAAVLRDRRREMISAWGKLYRRALFADVRYPVGKLHEDEFVTYRLYAACRRVSVLPQAYFGYFQRPESIMGVFKLQRLQALEAFAQSLAFTQAHLPKLYPAAYANYVMNLAIAYYRVRALRGEPRRAQCLARLRGEFLARYPGYRAQAASAASPVKRAAIRVFRLHPGLFCLGARFYLKVNPDA